MRVRLTYDRDIREHDGQDVIGVDNAQAASLIRLRRAVPVDDSQPTGKQTAVRPRKAAKGAARRRGDS